MNLNGQRIHLCILLAIANVGLVLASTQLGKALIVEPRREAQPTTWNQATNSTLPSLGYGGEGTGFVLEERSPDTPAPMQLQAFTFDIASVDSSGRVVRKRVGQAQYYAQDLGEGAKLDMVKIPAGTFMMGITFAEAEKVAAEERRILSGDPSLAHFVDEFVAMQVPQRSVSVHGFFIGKFEVTQAQWGAIARLPRVAKDILVNPSYFKGNELPVEEVTWEDAIEFCARLSRATGREYRLPSESEWEYACRAGTTSAFYFGDTVTPELVNYNGEYPYGLASKGIWRGRTIPVGSLGWPNLFGLYDMHGNVKEWCMDSWHENYSGAPRDGRIWNTAGGSPWTGCGSDYRVVRGGSWLQGPCGSAYRSRLWWTNNKNYFTGFRVVCSVEN